MKVNWRRVYDRDVPRLIAGAIILIVITIVAARCAASDAHASWRPTSRWEWHAADRATAYRLRWSSSPSCWPAANAVAITAYACTATTGICHGDIPMPSGDLVYIIVTASNARGESITEHGPVAATCDAP